MERDPRASNSRRLVYREEAYPIIGVPLLVLGLFLLSGSAISYVVRWLHEMPLFGEHGFQAHLGGLIVEVVILGIGWHCSASRRLVFDKGQGKLFKSTAFLPWHWTSTCDLHEFDGVVWNSHTTSSEHSSTTTYSVALVGPWRELELFETSREGDATKCVSNIAEFLGLEQRQGAQTGVTQLSARASLRVLKAFSFFWYFGCIALALFGLIFFATCCSEVFGGEVELREGLPILGFSILFVGMAIGFLFIGRYFFRQSIEALDREVKTVPLAAVAPTDSTSESANVDTRPVSKPTGSAVVAHRISLLSKWVAGAIPFFLFVYFAWNMFQDFDDEPTRPYQSAHMSGVESLRGSQHDGLWREWHEQTADIAAFVEEFGGKVNGSQKIGHLGLTAWMRCDLNLRDTRFGDDDLAKLVKLDIPRELYIGKRKIQGGGAIRGLRLDRTQITDSGLADLQWKNDLMQLSLIETPITDDGLAHLQGLNNLVVLRLDRTQISDRGLAFLKNLTNLRTLGLWDTQVTREGLTEFRRAIPECKVYADDQTTSERVFHDMEEVWDYYATEEYVGIGSFGDPQWPVKVAYEKEAMNDIAFVRKNGSKHLYPGYVGYRLKVVALQDSAGAETVLVFRSEEKVKTVAAP